jgi:hypothetical protein
MQRLLCCAVALMDGRLRFGRVYFNIAASDAPEPLSLFTECAVGSFDMSDGHQTAPCPTWLLDRGCPDSLFQHARAPGDLQHDRAGIAPHMPC